MHSATENTTSHCKKTCTRQDCLLTQIEDIPVSVKEKDALYKLFSMNHPMDLGTKKNTITTYGNEEDIEWLSRRRMAFMDAFDLGPRWHKLATGKTIFQVDDDGEPTLPMVGEQ